MLLVRVGSVYFWGIITFRSGGIATFFFKTPI